MSFGSLTWTRIDHEVHISIGDRVFVWSPHGGWWGFVTGISKDGNSVVVDGTMHDRGSIYPAAEAAGENWPKDQEIDPFVTRVVRAAPGTKLEFVTRGRQPYTFIVGKKSYDQGGINVYGKVKKSPSILRIWFKGGVSLKKGSAGYVNVSPRN